MQRSYSLFFFIMIIGALTSCATPPHRTEFSNLSDFTVIVKDYYKATQEFTLRPGDKKMVSHGICNPRFHIKWETVETNARVKVTCTPFRLPPEKQWDYYKKGGESIDTAVFTNSYY